MPESGFITGCVEVPYTRRPPASDTTEVLLTRAIVLATQHAGLEPSDVDGLGVASFTLKPDHAVDLAVKCGLRLRWIMEDTNGGASGLNMLQHALRAVQSGDAQHIVLVAGDRMTKDAFQTLVSEYNATTRDFVTPTGMLGPNPMFSLLTQRHMAAHDLKREDYGKLVVAQRNWAHDNPGAVYRDRLTIDDYLAAPPVAPPLHLLDCVPPVSGADAIVVSADQRANGARAVRVSAVANVVNDDLQSGDGLTTGLAHVAPGLWDNAGFGPEDVDVVATYDDYPVMVLVQLADLGLVPDGDLRKLLRSVDERRLPVNTSGGQLSAGQAGAAGGLHGTVEIVKQLRGEAGRRQVQARRALVSGYGMVTYSHGACANAAVLEAA